MKNYIKLMRPKHYLKNILIFFPLIFSGLLFQKDKFLSCFIGFVVFSLVASSIYIINDIRDKEKDKMHDIKKNRPIASGKVSVFNAAILAIVLIFVALLLQYFFLSKVTVSYLYILVYMILNIFYSFGFKNIPLVDITILVIGFLIRVLYGASLIGITISNWLYLTIISISFYLGLSKRRNEIKKSGSKSRKVLMYYNENFLDKNMYMCFSLAIVFYSLWASSFNNQLMMWTIPLVILVCMRYSMDIEKDDFGDPVDVIYSDKFLLIFTFLIGISIVGIIYFGGNL